MSNKLLGFESERYKTRLEFKTIAQRERFMHYAVTHDINYDHPNDFTVIIISENEERYQLILEFIHQETGLFSGKHAKKV